MAENRVIMDEEGLIKLVVGDREITLDDGREALNVNIVKEYVSEIGYRVEVEFSGSIDQATGTGQDFTEMDNLIRGESIEVTHPVTEYLALWLWQRIRYMTVSKDDSSHGIALQRITVRETDKCSVTIRKQEHSFSTVSSFG